MGFLDKVKDVSKAVGDKAQDAVDTKKNELAVAKEAKELDKVAQADLAETFQPTKSLGDLTIDMDNRLFKVKHARAGLKEKSSGLAKTGKVLAAVSTAGASIVADKAISAAMQPSDRIFSFNELVDYELLEDDSAITKGGLGMAAAGGALFGGFGAVAGAGVGKKKTKKAVESMILKINLNDIDFPCVMIPYITKSTKTTSKDYISAFNTAQETMSSLDIILRQEEADQQMKSAAPASGADPMDQIKKLKELLDMGAITQEEFDAKKKDILGL